MWLAGASEQTAARAAIARHRKTLLPPQDWEKLLGVGKQLPNAKRPNEITSQYCNWLTLEHCTCDTSHAVLNFLSLKTLQLSSRQNPDNSFAMLISCRPCRRPRAAAALQLWHGALAAAQSQGPFQTGEGG